MTVDLLDFALKLVLAEEEWRNRRRVEQEVRVEKKRKTITTSFGSASLPVTIASLTGEGRLVEFSARVTGSPELYMIVDNNTVLKSLDELASLSPFLEEIYVVGEDGGYRVGLKNIYFNDRLVIVLRGSGRLESAYLKVEKYEWS